MSKKLNLSTFEKLAKEWPISDTIYKNVRSRIIRGFSTVPINNLTPDDKKFLEAHGFS